MKANILMRPSEDQLLLDAARKRAQVFLEQGRYQEALDVWLEFIHAHPEIANGRPHPGIANGWVAAAVDAIHLGRWQDAIRYAQNALAHGDNTFGPYDGLAHAYGVLGQWDEARRYGLRALDMRDRRFGKAPVIPPPPPGPMPPPPSAQTRERNVIAFSLFGRDPRYCEPAVLNVQEQPRVYPHWVCRFYVDDSVPDNVIARLAKGGAQIVPVKGPAAQWPGTVWRLLALDDPQAHRILFRDADSVVSQREAGAVEQWLASGKRFHMMREWGSHTELMMAGLWGAVAGSLPPLAQLMQRFMSAPIASQRFADQYFLRQYIWPYARASLMQHDSIFGFMQGMPFPDGTRPDKDCDSVGYAEGVGSFTAQGDLQNGWEVVWSLYLIEKRPDGQTREERVCSYPGTVKDGALKAHIPMRYVQRMEQGTARIGLQVNRAA
jgi:hypothetical protein